MRREGPTGGGGVEHTARPKRKGIGDSPLDAVAELEETFRPTKERRTFHHPVDVMERAKDFTLADLAAQSLTETVDKLKNKRGEPFLPRNVALKDRGPMK